MGFAENGAFVFENASSSVMAGSSRAIHVFFLQQQGRRGARHPSTPRLRRAFSVPRRRSFGEGGKAGHDGLQHKAHSIACRFLSQTLRRPQRGR